jgi:vitamin B12 transporter
VGVKEYNMNHYTSVRTAFACVFLSTATISVSPLFAQNSQIITQQSQDPSIIVTATRTSNTVDETMAPVSILTAEDISRLQVNSVPEILSLSSGLDVNTSGGYGSISNIHIRGTNSDHVLTLIDGIPVGSATTGTMAFQYLPVDQIERIEIVRGPRSSLYGADAIGGVIQIFTKKSTQQQNASINVGYGTENTSKLNAHYSNGNENTQYHLGLSHFNTDGYNFIGDSNGKKHGYDNNSLSLTGSHKISDQIDLSALFLHSQGNSEFDGSFVNNTDYVEQVLGVKLKTEINELWDMSFKAGQNQSDSVNNRDDLKMSHFDTTGYNFSWQNDVVINDNNLVTLGFDYEKDKVNSNTDFTRASRANNAVFTQYQLFEKYFDLSASLRHDDNESYGRHNTGNLSLAIPVNQSVRLTAGYGTAFKAPTFNDLYYPEENYPAYTPGGPTSSYSGNPNLQPETSASFDIGINGNWRIHQWSVNYFNTEIDDLIEYVSEYDAATNNYGGTMKNISRAKIKGLEISYQVEFFDWIIQSNYTWLNPKNKDSGKLLPNRSEHLFNLQMDSHLGQLTYGGSLQASSQRYIDINEQFKLSGFTLFNLHADYQINKQWSVKAKVDNLFDKEYAKSARFALTQKYIAPGRNVFVSLQYKPFE